MKPLLQNNNNRLLGGDKILTYAARRAKRMLPVSVRPQVISDASRLPVGGREATDHPAIMSDRAKIKPGRSARSFTRID